MDSELRVQILGNPQTCRTEAEVSRTGTDAGAQILAVVYESPEGWRVEFETPEVKASDELHEAVLVAGREALMPYVNRRGESPPSGLTVGGLSLWLMEKADGTALGVRIR
jgi:hypothetical protein